jgi:hypothetical protein
MCDDDVTIGVTEVVNNIQVTAQPNDQIIDIDVIDNSDEVTLNVTPCLIEVNINKGSSFARWGTIYGNILDQVDLQNALFNKADLVNGVVPANQLPSYVDDVIEVANFSALPTVGETGKIYITLDNNKMFRWSGSVYVEISSGGGVWGAITGTLSNQTDLVDALNLKANDSDVVKLTGNQTIAGNKTFTTIGRTTFQNADLAQVSFKNTIDLTKVLSIGQGSSNSNIFSSTGIDFRVGGLTTSALLIASNENATFKENVTANSFIKSGGTSAQILAADGSVLTAGTNITILGGTISASGGGSTDPLEFNTTDRTVWNNGQGNIASNTSFGSGALKSNSTGQNCTAFGNAALFSSTTSAGNTAIGANALSFITTSAGSYNTAIGLNAGSVLSNGAGNINSNNCVFIGRNTSPLYNGTAPTNEIVIGDSTTGHGSNTVTLGNSSILTTILRGNVGIGTTSPSGAAGTALAINGGAGQTRIALKNNFTGDNPADGFQILLNAASADVMLENRENGYIGFATNDAERMRITSGGNVGIGTTSPSAFSGYRNLSLQSGTSGFNLDFFDNSGVRRSSIIYNNQVDFTFGVLEAIPFRFETNGSERMRITSSGSVVVNNLGTGTVYSNAGVLTNTNPSDERLKENIDDLEYGLAEILQLRPVSYNWINDTANQGKQFGFIAQEVQEIMPDLINEFTITEDEEEVVRLGLDKEAIFVAMVNAIKELKAEIDLLKQKA